MPPRLRLRSLAQLANKTKQPTAYVCARCQYATAATAATTPAPSEDQLTSGIPPLTRYSTVQPPSHRDPKYRKSQLLRSYVSLLQSTPLIILFQHNNLRALEWASIRRELANALQKVDDTLAKAQPQGQGMPPDALADQIKLQVVQTNMLEPALRITEYFKTDNGTSTDIVPTTIADEKLDPALTHALSTSAYLHAQKHKNQHPLTPMLVGNIAILTFPAVSPQHIKAALSILAPQAPRFPAPLRRLVPSFHEPGVQDGLKKLMLLGARIDGQIFDSEGARWVGSIEGGMEGLRAQLVYMLQGFGAGLAQTLEGASRSLWFTVESRRRMLDTEDENGGKAEDENAAKTD